MALLVAGGLNAPGKARAEPFIEPGVGAGPVFGYVFDRGATLGWEAAVSLTALPLLHLSFGGSYLRRGGEGRPSSLHYVALEPWLFVGATLGLAFDDQWNPQPLGGLWEGVPVPVALGPQDRRSVHVVITLSVGLRMAGQDTELYFAPKLYFQTYNGCERCFD